MLSAKEANFWCTSSKWFMPKQHCRSGKNFTPHFAAAGNIKLKSRLKLSAPAPAALAGAPAVEWQNKVSVDGWKEQVKYFAYLWTRSHLYVVSDGSMVAVDLEGGVGGGWYLQIENMCQLGDHIASKRPTCLYFPVELWGEVFAIKLVLCLFHLASTPGSGYRPWWWPRRGWGLEITVVVQVARFAVVLFFS